MSGKLTPEQRQEENRKIAVLCGWERVHLPTPMRAAGDMWGYWKQPDGVCLEEGFDPWNGLINLPDYCSSLDAMAGAEATLTEKEQDRYADELYSQLPEDRLVHEDGPLVIYIASQFSLIHATAEQRAIAFLAVKEKV